MRPSTLRGLAAYQALNCMYLSWQRGSRNSSGTKSRSTHSALPDSPGWLLRSITMSDCTSVLASRMNAPCGRRTALTRSACDAAWARADSSRWSRNQADVMRHTSPPGRTRSSALPTNQLWMLNRLYGRLRPSLTW